MVWGVPETRGGERAEERGEEAVRVGELAEGGVAGARGAVAERVAAESGAAGERRRMV